MPSNSTSSRSKRATSPGRMQAARKKPTIEEAPAIFDLLIADHRQVAAVFALLADAIEEDEPDAEECLRLFATVDALLTPHARAEERMIYPAFADANHEARSTVAEAIEEHALVHQLLAQIKELDEVDEQWCAKAKVMMDLVEHHVREEEGEQFEAARAGLEDDEARDLAAQFLASKLEIADELGLPPPDSLDLPAPKRTASAKA